MADTLLLSSGRAAAEEPTLDNNDVTPVLFDTRGRVLVSAKSAAYPPINGQLVNNGDTFTFNVEDASNIFIHMKNTGTALIGAGGFSFEASVDSTNGVDGTWFGTNVIRTAGNTVLTTDSIGGLSAGYGWTYGWRASTSGFKWFRLRCTTSFTASSIAYFTAIKSYDNFDPTPSTQAHAVTQSGAFTVTPLTPTAYKVTGTASTNLAFIKTSAGSLFEISVFNPTAAIFYVKLYDKATAPTVGTEVPVFSFPVAINALAAISFGELGKRFANGIWIATTVGPLATDTAAIAVGAQISASYV